jgi:DNA invertase Pin-like site-specific DNA recombinase
MKKAIAVIRTINKSSRGYQQQIRKINQYTDENGIQVVRFQIELGVEGKNLNRFEWKKTMKYINNHPNEVNLILVCTYDRILDDFHNTAKLMRRLKIKGIRILSIQETIPDSDPIHTEKYFLKT